MASVAMLLLESEIRFSRSTLHEVTASGWTMAILFSVFTAENRIVGLEDVKNIWRTANQVCEDNMCEMINREGNLNAEKEAERSNHKICRYQPLSKATVERPLILIYICTPTVAYLMLLTRYSRLDFPGSYILQVNQRTGSFVNNHLYI